MGEVDMFAVGEAFAGRLEKWWLVYWPENVNMQGLARAPEQQFIIATGQGQQCEARPAAKVFAPCEHLHCDFLTADVVTAPSRLILVALAGGCPLWSRPALSPEHRPTPAHR